HPENDPMRMDTMSKSTPTRTLTAADDNPGGAIDSLALPHSQGTYRCFISQLAKLKCARAGTSSGVDGSTDGACVGDACDLDSPQLRDNDLVTYREGSLGQLGDSGGLA
ncbi:hypothetical protein LCGC14_2220580, partial [marine sediment metagenome]